MPTLYELQSSSQALIESSNRVIDIARRSEVEDVDTNSGICSAAELIARAIKGNSIDFDYGRLILESESYE